MLIAIVENERFATIDRLAEIGRQGLIWKLGISREEFIWKMLSDERFPGLAPLVSLGLGINPGKRACALVKFAEIKKENGKIVKIGEAKPIGNFFVEIGNRRVEIREVGNYSIVFYEGSEKISENYVEEGEIKRIEALEKGAKESAKILRTFSAKIFERFSRFPMFYGFGKLRKYRRVEGVISSKSCEVIGIAKALGMKVVPIEKALVKEGLKILHIVPKSEKDLLPLIVRSEIEKVAVIIPKKIFAGFILAGEGIEPDSGEKMLFEAKGLGTIDVNKLREILKEYGSK